MENTEKQVVPASLSGAGADNTEAKQIRDSDRVETTVTSI